MPSSSDTQSASLPSAANPRESPIAQLLSTLGMTREDLEKHTFQMRQFLDSEDARKIVSAQAAGELRGGEQDISREEMLAYITGAAKAHESSRKSNMPPPSRSGHHETSSPSPTEAPSLRHSRSMSCILKSRSRHDRDAECSAEQGATRRTRASTLVRHLSRTAVSPSTRPKLSLDEVMQMRSQRSRRVSSSEESEESGDESLRDVFTKAQAGASTPRYRYPHPAKATRSSADASNRHYRDYSPAPSRSGRYYRDEVKADGSVQSPSQSSQIKTVSYYRNSYASRSHALSSSPAASSPLSSPVRYPYNIVSSPGPMSDPPDHFAEELPYTLPPGPYSEEKPDFSYAALIGQAILASSGHALRLKDIYDYISIVYPYFKRDGHSHSQKWMNAIRQNLTNTPQFFKKEHPSGKASKGALWCIADKDLPCFADGGYNRHALNPDSVQSQKAEKRKRKKEEKLKEEKAKRVRLAAHMVQTPYTFSYGVAPFHRPAYAIAAAPAPIHPDVIFPPLPAGHPNAHLINSATDSGFALDKDVIFPPLPAYSQTRIAQEEREKELSRESSISLPDTPSRRSSEPASDGVPSSPATVPPPSSEASVSSIPGLTPNNSSSSPREGEDDEDEDEFAYFSEYLESETQSLHEETDEIAPIMEKGKGKEKADETYLLGPVLSEPSSPVLGRGVTHATRSPSTSLYAGSGFLGYPVNRSSTPPNDLSVYLGASHTLTPLSRRNPPSTPTRKKKALRLAEEDLGGDDRPDFLKMLSKTPSRRKDDESTAGPSNAPVTPRKMFSPFIGFSPFRTPSRRSIFDAADPSRMLDDELEALSAAKQRASDSPIGLFPRGKGLLYESPSLPSPGRWRPW